MPEDRRAPDLVAVHQQLTADMTYLEGVWLRLAKTKLIIEGARLVFSDSVEALNRDGQATSVARSNVGDEIPDSGLSPDGNHVDFESKR